MKQGTIIDRHGREGSSMAFALAAGGDLLLIDPEADPTEKVAQRV